MTGSQYAALYRRSVDDLRSLAETDRGRAQDPGAPSVARGSPTPRGADYRRGREAALSPRCCDAHFETQQIPGNDLSAT